MFLDFKEGITFFRHEVRAPKAEMITSGRDKIKTERVGKNKLKEYLHDNVSDLRAP